MSVANSSKRTAGMVARRWLWRRRMVKVGSSMRMWLVAGAGPSCQLGHGGKLAAPGCFPPLDLGDRAVDCMRCVYSGWLPCKFNVAKHAFCKL